MAMINDWFAPTGLKGRLLTLKTRVQKENVVCGEAERKIWTFQEKLGKINLPLPTSPSTCSLRYLRRICILFLIVFRLVKKIEKLKDCFIKDYENNEMGLRESAKNGITSPRNSFPPPRPKYPPKQTGSSSLVENKARFVSGKSNPFSLPEILFHRCRMTRA